MAWVLADHACRTITGADEKKLNELDEMSVEKWWNEICGRVKRKKPRENLLRPVSSITKPTWSDRDVNSGPSVWRRMPNRLHHEATMQFLYLGQFVTNDSDLIFLQFTTNLEI